MPDFENNSLKINKKKALYNKKNRRRKERVK
jgi:hypothetical protein